MEFGWSLSIWFILAQVMGLITICFEFVSYQIKNQRNYLLVTSIGNIFWMLMFLFMGLHTSLSNMQAMVFAAAFGVARGLIFWWIFGKKTRRRKIIGRVALYVSLAVAIPFTIMTIVRLPYNAQIVIQSIGLFTALLFIIGQYLPSKHYLRVFVFMYATMMLLANTPLNIRDENGVGYWNYMGIIIELAKLTSVLVFYGLIFRRRYVVAQLERIREMIREEIGNITGCTNQSELATTIVQTVLDYEKSKIEEARIPGVSRFQDEIREAIWKTPEATA